MATFCSKQPRLKQYEIHELWQKLIKSNSTTVAAGRNFKVSEFAGGNMLELDVVVDSL